MLLPPLPTMTMTTPFHHHHPDLLVLPLPMTMSRCLCRHLRYVPVKMPLTMVLRLLSTRAMVQV